jgi:isoleucyl-tRNA synthetase
LFYCRWVFSQLYSKGLVYKGLKVMPVSTGCATTLANFEAGQNYKVRPPKSDNEGSQLLAQQQETLWSKWRCMLRVMECSGAENAHTEQHVIWRLKRC